MGKHRNSNSHSSKQSQRIIRNGLKVQRESFKKQQEAGDGDDDAVLALQLKACIPIAFSLSLLLLLLLLHRIQACRHTHRKKTRMYVYLDVHRCAHSRRLLHIVFNFSFNTIVCTNSFFLPTSRLQTRSNLAIKGLGLKLKDMRGDGNCLFRYLHMWLPFQKSLSSIHSYANAGTCVVP